VIELEPAVVALADSTTFGSELDILMFSPPLGAETFKEPEAFTCKLPPITVLAMLKLMAGCVTFATSVEPLVGGVKLGVQLAEQVMFPMSAVILVDPCVVPGTNARFLLLSRLVLLPPAMTTMFGFFPEPPVIVPTAVLLLKIGMLTVIPPRSGEALPCGLLPASSRNADTVILVELEIVVVERVPAPVLVVISNPDGVTAAWA